MHISNTKVSRRILGRLGFFRNSGVGLALLAITLLGAACTSLSDDESPAGPSKSFTSPAHGMLVQIPDSLFADGLFLKSGDNSEKESNPERIKAIILDQVDSYTAQWIITRSPWQASTEHIRDIRNRVVNDCTFACSASFNGLCAGTTDLFSSTTVALYRLKRSRTKPVGWDEPGRYLQPRRSEDMRDLAYANGRYWINEEPNEYYWCEMPKGNRGMPALQHEWDHILPNMDPHDPSDLQLITTAAPEVAGDSS